MRLTRVFFGVDMRKNFDGLRKIARGADTALGPESSVLFINTARTSFKIMRGNKYLVYYSNGGRRIPMEAIQYLPREFGGSAAEMSQAIEKSLREKVKFL